MIRQYMKHLDKIKTFTRLGKKNPRDLFASDWALKPSGGYNDSYALIHSDELNLSLSYGVNSYPLVSFMSEDVINGRLELCKKEKKDILTINGESNLVFTSVGLIPVDEFDLSIYEIDSFRETGGLGYGDMTVGSIYVALDGKLFVYLGFVDNADSPKIREITLKNYYSSKMKDVVTFKKAKNFGKTVFIDELTSSDMELFLKYFDKFNDLKQYVSDNCLTA